MEVVYDGRCFGCGEANPEGLQMVFEPVGGESVCESFEVPQRFQSWQGVVHGGMVALMLDEAAGWAAWHADRPGVTGRLEVKYRTPLLIGERVRVAGRVERVRRTLTYCVASITRATGEVVAEATAVLMETPTAVRT